MKTKKTIKTKNLIDDFKIIDKDLQKEKEKTEELINNKGWNSYINKCVDIIYFNFNNFGWTYGMFSDKPVTREDIENNIIELIGHSVKSKGQVESGRIAVDIIDDQLWIALTL